jgi:hemin uptake protein HemP
VSTLIRQEFTGPSQIARAGATKDSLQMNRHDPDRFRANDYGNHRSRPQADAERPANRAAVRTLASSTLFAGEHEIGIEHHGALYRLKITRQGKLILNK